jgi:hypothetical protein
VRTLALDFDGVLHWYREGWKDGSIYDEPVPGAVEACEVLGHHYRLVIFSSRAATAVGIADMQKWLRWNGFPTFAEITSEKPIATMYVDDRAYRFEGDWETALDEIGHALTFEEAKS